MRENIRVGTFTAMNGLRNKSHFVVADVNSWMKMAMGLDPEWMCIYLNLLEKDNT